jgi:membrane protein
MVISLIAVHLSGRTGRKKGGKPEIVANAPPSGAAGGRAKHGARSDILLRAHYTRHSHVTKTSDHVTKASDMTKTSDATKSSSAYFSIALRVQSHRLLRLLQHVQRRFKADDCSRSAAALTYMSLFAVVPLMTVVFAMLSAVPAFGGTATQLQNFVFSHFMPASGQEIEGYLLSFSVQARKLTGIGVAFLMVTALTMLTNIEKVFNAIWRTRGHRSGLSSFLRYWAILSLGPLCIGLALGISTYLVSLHWLTEVDLFGVRKLLLSAAPLLLTIVAFTLLFAAMPNTRVPIRHALIGGAACGICLEIAKQVFTLVMANASYQLIYGTFAAIPLFLLWIYISWIMVLAGAELVHALSGFDHRDDLPDIVAALSILEILWRYHQRGMALSERELLGKRRLLDRHTLSIDHWAALRDTLLDATLIKIDSNGAYILGRDLRHYTLADLCTRFRQLPVAIEYQYAAATPWLNNYQQLFTQLDTQNRQQLQLSLAELFAQADTVEPQSQSPFQSIGKN